MAAINAVVQPGYMELRGLYLGADFVRERGLEPGKKYPIIVEGLPATELLGTLNKSSFIGGLAKLYRTFDLAAGDRIGIDFKDGRVIIVPPPEKKRSNIKAPPEATTGAIVENVFSRRKLRHLYIERYSPGNLSNWEPRTEPDVYMVFGALAEIHDYHYCCGASSELLGQLGYKSDTKPDAIVIDDATDEYLLAEFKIRSSDFKGNHKPDDVDLLVCWVHDEADPTTLPPRVLDLSNLRRKAIVEGDIDLS